jgi:hypothetical protein
VTSARGSPVFSRLERLHALGPRGALCSAWLLINKHEFRPIWSILEDKAVPLSTPRRFLNERILQVVVLDRIVCEKKTLVMSIEIDLPHLAMVTEPERDIAIPASKPSIKPTVVGMRYSQRQHAFFHHISEAVINGVQANLNLRFRI